MLLVRGVTDMDSIYKYKTFFELTLFVGENGQTALLFTGIANGIQVFRKVLYQLD